MLFGNEVYGIVPQRKMKNGKYLPESLTISPRTCRTDLPCFSLTFSSSSCPFLYHVITGFGLPRAPQEILKVSSGFFENFVRAVRVSLVSAGGVT